MANTYYKKITAGVVEERYSFLSGGISVYITEAAEYRQSLNTSKTESQVVALGFSAITETEWNNYVDDIESFARVGGHPPSKP